MPQNLAGWRRLKVRAGTLVIQTKRSAIRNPGWIPAFAGMTNRGTSVSVPGPLRPRGLSDTLLKRFRRADKLINQET